MFDADTSAVAEHIGVLAPETLVAGLRGEHAREWRQFLRWATATDRTPLPASAATLHAYLDAYPGTIATQRGRASAVTAAHRTAHRPSPAEAETIRRRLRPGRAERLTAARAHIDALLPHLPVTGFPDGLTGRRDAVILHLAASGLSWDRIAGLRQRDVHLTDDTVTVGEQPLIVLSATDIPASCPVAVLLRWATVLTYAPEPTGHIALADILNGAAEEPAGSGLLDRYADQPLLTGFDPNGIADGVIGELDPMARDEIAAILTTAMNTSPPTAAAELDPAWHERGIAARHRDHAAGNDLDELLTRLETMLDHAADLTRRPD